MSVPDLMHRTETLGETWWVNWAFHLMASEQGARDLHKAFNETWDSKR